MYICKVQGKCVSTIKNKALMGCSLVTTQRLNESGNPTGEIMVAVDTIGCSVGEIVLVTAGSSARCALGHTNSPADSAIIGIVDTCDLNQIKGGK
ncbi:EutN/CcmL family microcompartment protein [Maledivibacter halophilus]|uniref:Ethanolamine utilization protein EutN n=1 Tax=Maledivibacter halophilus TaxID=36842 RepID=A0A1T5I9U4_9FIRM|nr:EutN/CcmL family microcompartment protein [Maledivibacter halophilus]SKC35974.1 ethanolamine utilization protein EutN [Maledivibacter halophilus]